MSTDTMDGTLESEPDVMELPATDALAALNRSEIDMQISTAKKYPRSVTRFKHEVEQLACLDEETAATMFYSLPRGGKPIIGPSIRFAEVVSSSWGNLRSGARVIAIDDKHITAQGMCFDLEKNIIVQVEVKRRITDKHGTRYNDDMIVVTGNAACSIALRNAVFKVVPFGLAKGIYQKCLDVVRGNATTLSARRATAMEWFTKAGATQEQVLQALERASLDDVTIDDLVTLTGLRNAIKEGEATIEEVLGPVPDKTKKVKRSDLNAVAGNGGKTTEPTDHWSAAREAFAGCQTKEAIIAQHQLWSEKTPDNESQAIIDKLAEEAHARVAPKTGKQKQTELMK